ncbi:MAG: M20/M25/M40 family metallo-hydrolase [Vicinamibacterales bacterium]
MLKQFFISSCVVASVAAVVSAQSAADAALFEKIRAEGMDRSQAEAMFSTLTVDIGPRLTASPAHKRAAEWAKDSLTKMGLANARLEPWKFGRGWEANRVVVEMIEPRYLPIIAYADGWSASTAGELVGAPVLAGDKSPEQLDAMKASLKGAIVLTAPMFDNFVRKDRPNPSDPTYQANGAAYATSVGRPAQARPQGETPAQRAARIFREAGAGVLIKPTIGEHGTVFVTGRDGGPGAVPALSVASEQYNMLLRYAQKGIPVKLRVNVQTTFFDNDNGNAYNVLAELPGTDPAVKDEVVMIGGHLDSWHTGVGATDNADGSVTMMEAMRILKASGAQPKRTIRVALWGGEEQGLLGSAAWVQQHLAGDANRAAREKFDVYFNSDNGYGPIWGFYLENSQANVPVFERWLAPLKAVGIRRNTIEGVGSTDHLSFIAAGVPGFNPIQRYENYDIRTHHSNMDTVERLDVKEIRQAATVMAWVALQAANDAQMVPRLAH